MYIVYTSVFMSNKIVSYLILSAIAMHLALWYVVSTKFVKIMLAVCILVGMVV